MKSTFYDLFHAKVEALGGFHNAHLHLDRAYTLDSGYVDHGKVEVLESSHMSLQTKHALIHSIHAGPAYDPDDLERRVGMAVDHMVEVNTRVADTVVDVTADRVGLTALEVIQSLAKQRSDDIVLRAGAYTPLGFMDSEPERWRVFEQGVERADFIGSLPEIDDVEDYPDKIGFEEHCLRVLDLSKRSGKFLHIHTDQLNSAGEGATERLLNVMRSEDMRLEDETGAPLVWAIHMISPSMYDEARWEALVEGLLELNVGVISCPSGAVGMRQLRSIQSPTYNSIARVLELIGAGVPVRLGSDNIADMCSPTTTPDLTEEVFMLSAAVRYYNMDILSKLATGTPLSEDDRAAVREHLEKNNEEMARLVKRFGPR